MEQNQADYAGEQSGKHCDDDEPERLPPLALAFFGRLSHLEFERFNLAPPAADCHAFVGVSATRRYAFAFIGRQRILDGCVRAFCSTRWRNTQA